MPEWRHINGQAWSIARRCCTTIALLAILATSAAAQPRIVAIGDIHGAYPQLVAILQRTGLIDAHGQWSGGSAILVQIGDVPGRGAHSRKSFDLLMELERQAAKQNGQVVPLLGNHEVMVLMGDLRYTLPEEVQAFATEQSAQVRERAYEEYKQFLAARARRRPSASHDRKSRDNWMAEHPLGFFEYRDAFGPAGLYGRWLRTHDAVAQVGDVLFLHGGLSPKLKFRSLRDLNMSIHAELARFDSIWQSLSEKGIIWRYMKLEEAVQEIRAEFATRSPDQEDDPSTMRDMQELLTLHKWLTVSPDGPLWYRGYAWEPEQKLQRALEKTLSRLNARYIVAAHTITDTRRITPRFDKRVFLIDTGMAFHNPQGHASALEILNGRFVAYYSDGKQDMLLRPEDGGTLAQPAKAVPEKSSN